MNEKSAPQNLTLEALHTKFTTRIGVYNGFLFQTESHFSDALRYQQILARNSNQSETFVRPLLGSNLFYQNPLTNKTEFAFQYAVNDANISDSLIKLKRHLFNSVIAQCYEAFETYLKDAVAYGLAKTENGKLHDDLSIHSQDFEACRVGISEKCRSKNNKKLFKLLYALNPNISNHETNNHLGFNFQEWYIVFSLIRHSITHSNSKFEIQKSRSWSALQKNMLTTYFVRAEEMEKEWGIISTVRNYTELIRIIAQHAQIIQDSLCEKLMVGK